MLIFSAAVQGLHDTILRDGILIAVLIGSYRMIQIRIILHHLKSFSELTIQCIVYYYIPLSYIFFSIIPFYCFRYPVSDIPR